MVVGSECAREFHAAIGLNPDLAPLSQVLLVIVFGELAPMFAARHYAEHVAMLGVPLVYASAKILTPALWVIGWISKAASLLFRGKQSPEDIFLSQEELQAILEEHGEETPRTVTQEFNAISRNIFLLRHKDAQQILSPLNIFPRLPSNATIVQMKNLIRETNADFVMVYYQDPTNIVGIAFPRDLVRIPESKRIRDYARPPWFVTEKTKLTQILQQFQHNNQRVAIIIDKKGKALGLITLDDLLYEVLGEAEYNPAIEKSRFILERTFSGDLTVGAFNHEFGVILNSNEKLTLSQLMSKELGHHPEEGESVYIEPFELTAKEASLLEIKSVIVKTKPK
jgi:CBS domain containing-hemolysin-like protein